jgi:hypothetical protein
MLWLLGLLAWGDLGDMTWYRSHDGRVVVIPKTWPAKPPSPAQTAQRNAFAAAIEAWVALPTTTKQQWTTAARRASLCMHGADLFVHWYLIRDDQAIETLERQTKTSLLP